MNIKTKMIALFLCLALFAATFIFFITGFVLRYTTINLIGNSSAQLAKEQITAVDRVIYERLDHWDSYVKSNNAAAQVLKLSNQEFDSVNNKYAYIDAENEKWMLASKKKEITPLGVLLTNSNFSKDLTARADFYKQKYKYNIFPEIVLVNKYGVNVAQTGLISHYSHVSDDWWQKTKERGLYAGDIFYDERYGAYLLNLCVRIDDNTDGSFLGVLKVVYNIKDLFEIINQTDDAREKNSNVYLLTDDGRLIYSLKESYGSLVPRQDILRPFFNNTNSVSGYYFGKYNGVNQFLIRGLSNGYKNFKGLGWSLIISHDPDEVLSTTKIFYFSLLPVLSVTPIVFFFIIFFTNLIIKPLKRLQDDVVAISNGDLDHPISSASFSETGQLSGAFQTMVSAVKNAHDEITGKVREQTKEIGKKAQELEDQKEAILNILEDVAEEKTKAEIMAHDLEKFKMAVDDASDHVVITDAEGILLYANKAVEKITGYKVKEVLGKKVAQLWKKPMSRQYYENLWRTIKTNKKTFEGEVTNVKKGGQEYESAISIAPVLDKSGVILYFVGIGRDITKEREIDKAKTEFVSLASHQLRTPLSTVNWYAEMLLNGDAGKITAEQSQYVQEIYRGNQRMVDLVNSLLNVSRLELGMFIIEPEDADIGAILKDVVDDLLAVIANNNITFKNKSEKLPIMKLDKKITHMILENILSNAMKYSFKNGTVTIDMRKRQKDILITVTDQGLGIPLSQRDNIFTKLFRADNVRAADTEGTGLGLYLVKMILNYIGGEIWFESEENKETTFFVTLPIAGMKKKAGDKTLL